MLTRKDFKIKRDFNFCYRNGSAKVLVRVTLNVDKTERKEPTVIVEKVGKALAVSDFISKIYHFFTKLQTDA